MYRNCPHCEAEIAYQPESPLSLGACPDCHTLMLFPAQSALAPEDKSSMPARPALLPGGAPGRGQWTSAIFTLLVGVLLVWGLSAFYTTGIIRLLGVGVPLSEVPSLHVHFALVSIILTAAILWLAVPHRGRFGRISFYLLSGVAPGAIVGRGLKQLAQYRSAMRLHRLHQ